MAAAGDEQDPATAFVTHVEPGPATAFSHVRSLSQAVLAQGDPYPFILSQVRLASSSPVQATLTAMSIGVRG